MAQKLLLVEDDAINVKFMQVVLTRKGGFEVVVSEDPLEILEIARTGGVAGIIMDVSLARSTMDGVKMDGLGITRLLKADPATAHIPVLIATAHAMFGDRERFLADTGAEGYLAKPFHDPDAFLNEVRRVIPKA